MPLDVARGARREKTVTAELPPPSGAAVQRHGCLLGGFTRRHHSLQSHVHQIFRVFAYRNFSAATSPRSLPQPDKSVRSEPAQALQTILTAVLEHGEYRSRLTCLPKVRQ